MVRWLIWTFIGIGISLFGQEEKPKKLTLIEREEKTSHSLGDLNYQAIAGTFLQKDKDEEVIASLFYVAYLKEGEENRPITFCFNGGPGSSSVWLHLGAFGPKKVALDEQGVPKRPYALEDNTDTLLDVTDIVFIDPVSTGFSRALSEGDAKSFHGVEEDIKSIAEFIRLFITRHNRWLSPKYLAGESYGTTRAAGLALYMHDQYNISLDGIVLVSTILNFQAYQFDSGNDLPYITSLPTYTATAWYHKRLKEEYQSDLDKALKASETFAMGPYATALLQGSSLPEEQRVKINEQLAALTGISQGYLQQTKERVSVLRFLKELLRDQQKTLGRFDSRFTGIDYNTVGETIGYDASAELIFPAFTAALNNYVRDDLNYKEDRNYRILENVFPWNWTVGNERNRYLNVADDLREVMTKNPDLQVIVISGLCDMATPYFAVDYTLNHLGLDPSLMKNITHKKYMGGHMMYTYLPTLKAMNQDIKNYYRK